MTKERPLAPALGDAVRSARPSAEALELLVSRRSTLARLLGDPGPSERELELMLQIGCRVPDHRRLEPWRLIVISGSARDAMRERLREIYAATQQPGSDEEREKSLQKLGAVARAPVTICVVSAFKEDTDKARKTPAWEQHLSAGALCQNLLLAANASGYAAQWVTEWYAYEPRVHETLGLEGGEQIAGFIFVGTATQDPLERSRPTIVERVHRWTGEPVSDRDA